METIVIVGAGGFGREVKTIIDAVNLVENKFQFLGYFDDNIVEGTLINGFPVLGNLDKLNQFKSSINVVLGIGDPETKAKIVEVLHNGNIKFPTVIHPSVIMSNDSVSIGYGCIICAGTIITCNVEIHNFVTLNLLCTVGHDSNIGNYASFMPSVNISGEVVIHEKVYVGTGAKIINLLSVGQSSIIGAGAVVSRNIPEFCTAVGIPAKPIKYHNQKTSNE